MLKVLTQKQVLYYEVNASWWAQWVSIPVLQEVASMYFAQMVERKYNRYIASLARKEQVATNAQS
jgi:hypothetical protein